MVTYRVPSTSPSDVSSAGSPTSSHSSQRAVTPSAFQNDVIDANTFISHGVTSKDSTPSSAFFSALEDLQDPADIIEVFSDASSSCSAEEAEHSADDFDEVAAYFDSLPEQEDLPSAIHSEDGFDEVAAYLDSLPDENDPMDDHRPERIPQILSSFPHSDEQKSNSSDLESASSHGSPRPVTIYEDAIAAVLQREYATDVLPDGSAFDGDCDPAYEAVVRDLPWYSLEDLLILCRKGATAGQYWSLPESLVWRTLLTLLKDAALLHSGVRISEGDKSGPPDWQPILHNSIHPCNIWYEKVTPEKGGPLGRCVLGRMSRCRILAGTFESNRRLSDEAHRLRSELEALPKEVDARGYEAPEICEFDSGNQPCCTASDIWSIGAVILAMMTGENVHEVARKRTQDFGSSDTAVGPDLQAILCAMTADRVAGIGENIRLHEALPESFDEGLRKLVESMLRRKPSRRPTAVRVIKRVQAAYNQLDSEKKSMGVRMKWAMRGLRMAKQEIKYYD